MPQQRGFQAAAVHVVPVADQRQPDKLQRLLQIAAPRFQTGQPVEPGTLGLGAPGGFVEGVVGFAVLAVRLQRQPQMEKARALVGVGVLPGLFLNGLFKTGDALPDLSLAEEQQPVAVVQPQVGGVAAQPFPVIVGRVAGGMAVLFEMGRRQIQFLGGAQLLRRAERLGGGGDGPQFRLIHPVAHQGAVPGLHRDLAVVQRAVRGKVCPEPALRREVGARLIQAVPAALHPDHGAGLFPGDIDPHLAAAVGKKLQTHGGIPGGVAHPAHPLVGQEILDKGLFLLGLEPGKIRLIVGEHAGHQFNVRPVRVGQVAVPGAAEIAVAPGPLFFARRHMVVRHMKQPGLAGFVVVAHKVKVRVGRHVGGRDRHVLVARDVHPRRVVALVVFAGRNREGRDRAPAVVHDGVHVGRKDRVGVIVDRHRGVGPPQEGLRQVGGIVQPAPDFQIRLAGVQADCGHPLGAVHLVGLADIDGHRAVVVLGHAVVHRREGGRAVMLRPVEFNPARNPWPGQPHQRRFDDVVVIDKIIAVGLVEGAVNPSAQFGQDHDAQILVFQPDGMVGDLPADIRHLLGHRQRIDLAGAALVGAFFNEKRIFFRLGGWIGRKKNGLLPDFCGVVHHQQPSFLAGWAFRRAPMLPLYRGRPAGKMAYSQK